MSGDDDEADSDYGDGVTNDANEYDDDGAGVDGEDDEDADEDDGDDDEDNDEGEDGEDDEDEEDDDAKPSILVGIQTSLYARMPACMYA